MKERRHSRVPLQEVKETSANGVYLTKEELQKYGIFASVMLLLFACIAIFDRKH